ncbi:MAG: hybrid sensor histidine kinase/response regulator [Variovorax sp.]|nr:MAG: hybrid sensor histidine kinase/response regulator [Variovorax sp.]
MSATTSATVSQAQHREALQRELMRERIRLHSAMFGWLPAFHVALVALLMVTVLRELPRATTIAWACTVIVIESARASYGYWVLRHIAQIDVRYTRAGQTLACFVSAAALGSVAPLFLGQLSPAQQTLLIAVLSVVPSIGAAVSTSSRFYVLSYASGVILPTVGAWIHTYPTLGSAAVLLSITHVGVIYLATCENARTLKNSCAIRLQRDQTLRELERSNAAYLAAVEVANKESTTRARVLAAASHDLRQPLNALSLYSAVLSTNPTASVQVETGQRIGQLVHSLGELLHGLLDLSQFSSGQYVLVREPLDMGSLLESLCIEFEPIAQAKGLQLRREIGAVTLMGDPMAVARMARNLIDNAVKYTDTGWVEVRLGHEAETAVLTVSDTGCGIEPAQQARIFEEFYQVGNPGRDRSQGVGLGLTIVERLVELTGGAVMLDSEPGKGSTFRVALPGVVKPHAVDLGVHPNALDASGEQALHVEGDGRRVIVLDDEHDIIRSMSALLKLWGFMVGTASDAEEVTALFAHYGVPDLLIADLRLRGAQSGLDVALALREQHGVFPVLFVTGETSSASLQSLLEQEHPLLYKPIDPMKLRQAIDLLAPSRVQPD